jgi:methionyl aminopeptidase
VVCHDIPSDRDILKIDVTVILNGWYGDTSRIFWIGKPNTKSRRLISVTYEAMIQALALCAMALS